MAAIHNANGVVAHSSRRYSKPKQCPANARNSHLEGDPITAMRIAQGIVRQNEALRIQGPRWCS